MTEKCWLTLIILINLVRKLVIKCYWKNNIFTVSIEFCDWHKKSLIFLEITQPRHDLSKALANGCASVCLGPMDGSLLADMF